MTHRRREPLTGPKVYYRNNGIYRIQSPSLFVSSSVPNQPDTAHLPRPRTVSEPFAKLAPHIPAPSPATSGPQPLHGNSHLPNVCKKLLVTTCVWQCMVITMRCFARYYYSLRIRSGQYIR
ncbi:hypothetical protein FOTG_01490 [Fusarium oxysporum f. sp. vasinfectum 25433]|uniref:Uncharacterized protein n=1 Tax=Fusarium oxysporum f. sp. vasinfectum 25433 TaxID=1089449 RepID=X0MN51_FUSOX|nr:hypothetical protein FOTG_01490 [Fusarium oxysporum f. sp. vasinfectum 25433]